MSKKIIKASGPQHLRLLERLKKGPCSTVEARHDELLDIVQPAARVHKLRHEYGYNIKKVWITALNPGGSRHPFAEYVLFPGKYKGDKKNGVK